MGQQKLKKKILTFHFPPWHGCQTKGQSPNRHFSWWGRTRPSGMIHRSSGRSTGSRCHRQEASRLRLNMAFFNHFLQIIPEFFLKDFPLDFTDKTYLQYQPFFMFSTYSKHSIELLRVQVLDCCYAETNKLSRELQVKETDSWKLLQNMFDILSTDNIMSFHVIGWWNIHSFKM